MERLKGKKQIEKLFVSGRSIGAFPLRLVYIETEIINKVGVSVSKKHFKNAVDRNKIKRAAREAFRRCHLKGIDVVLILKNEKFYDQTKCFTMINEVFNDLMKK